MLFIVRGTGQVGSMKWMIELDDERDVLYLSTCSRCFIPFPAAAKHPAICVCLRVGFVVYEDVYVHGDVGVDKVDL